MDEQKVKELHMLLFTFMGIFHEKIIGNFRSCAECQPKLKKNHSKILHVLYQKDSITPTELGKMLDLEKGGLTTIIDQLVDMQLVVRLADPSDRRKILLSLSVEGKERMENVLEQFSQSLMKLFKNVDQKELDQYISNLRQVTKFMEKI